MYQYKAKVRRVIDGDSIVCDIDLGFGIILKERNIRLFGIDTCEIRSKNLADDLLEDGAQIVDICVTIVERGLQNDVESWCPPVL